jgi:hypothetical protein
MKQNADCAGSHWLWAGMEPKQAHSQWEGGTSNTVQKITDDKKLQVLKLDLWILDLVTSA